MRRDSPTGRAPSYKPRPGAKIVNQQEGAMVRIGDSIEVFVITARNGHAKLTISAPRNLEITAPKQ